MTKLSVNVNKLATLRNSRGGNNPDVVKTSLDIIRFGAEGITVHPRPDARHIRHDDVRAPKAAINVELNVEGYPSEDLLALVEEVRPAQVTFVPDPPDAITSNAGWDVAVNSDFLASVMKRMKKSGVRTSVFIDPSTMVDADYALTKSIGVDRVELYTERFAHAIGRSDEREVIEIYRSSAALAHGAKLGINAGHDLSLQNLAILIREIPMIDEVSIGHALICDALEFGLEKTVQRYLEEIKNGSTNNSAPSAR